MTDLQALLILRKQGARPASVWLVDWKADPAFSPELGGLIEPEEPTISILGMTPALEDLRCMQGCVVHVFADTDGRGIEWADRLLVQGAAVVYTHTEGGLATWRQ